MFQFLDHPSEAFIQVTANTVEEVFQEAALALFEIMTDTAHLQPELEFPVELESPERHLLLIDWLNRLILLHEVERVFLGRFQVKIQQTTDWKLSANVAGERIRGTHEHRSQAKSTTFGQFEWLETDQGHRVRFVVDI